ncbi:alpha/beta hydrolase [Halobacillus kuroshimensis]|uniref:alpha/beta hydrolase n=1 Tax=Halobacillus kuroshimensis TaxID=302481 RepID=UPI0003F742B9|nr:alpha/beta hydrolase-fold protein [Halobacillus kuroshimensis]
MVRSFISNHSIESVFLKKTVTYRLLKSGEAPGDCVDLLIVHDGDDYLKLGMLKEQFENDLQKGLGRNTCFILLPPGTSIDRWHYYHSEGRDVQAFQQFIYEELLPELRETFKIRKLGMLGDSLAGAVSLRLALHDPNQWTHILLQSAAFSEKDIKGGANLHKILPWTIYQSVGTGEDDFVSPITNEYLYILTRNRQLKTSIQTAQHIYVESDHGHLWECWREDLSSAVNIFYTK